MERIYHLLSDDALKELYVALKRAQKEFRTHGPRLDFFNWFNSHSFATDHWNAMWAVWAEMDARGLLDNDNNVVS